MVFDSHSTKSPFCRVGTGALGLPARYSGVFVTPNPAPASMRSNGTSCSCAVRATLRTLIDESRPQRLQHYIVLASDAFQEEVRRIQAGLRSAPRLAMRVTDPKPL